MCREDMREFSARFAWMVVDVGVEDTGVVDVSNFSSLSSTTDSFVSTVLESGVVPENRSESSSTERVG